jgi:hypothetical protein
MDIRNLYEEKRYSAAVKKLEAANAEEKNDKGKAVQVHPPPGALLRRFMASLMTGSFETSTDASIKGVSIPIVEVPDPYPPSIIPVSDLGPTTISRMQLECQHRGKKVVIRVLTPPARTTAVMAVVEDKEGIVALLQLHQQPEEEVVPCSEILLPKSIAMIKEPYFKKSADGHYALRIDHPSDVIWLRDDDERVPKIWRGKSPQDIQETDESRLQGDRLFDEKEYAAALRL